MKRALLVFVLVALLGATMGCRAVSGLVGREPPPTATVVLAPTPTIPPSPTLEPTATSTVTLSPTPDLAATVAAAVEKAVATAANALLAPPTWTAVPAGTSTPTPTVTPGGPTPIPDSVLDYGINLDLYEFTFREAELAVRVFNGDPDLGVCVVAARTYMEGFFEEVLPTWGEPVTETLAAGQSWTTNGVTLVPNSNRIFSFYGEGDDGYLVEVTAPAGTLISQLACRDGSLYPFNAPIGRDRVAYLFVWRSGLSRALFMGACANFGVVEEFLPTPTPVPSTGTPKPPTPTPCWTETPGPTATPTSTSPPSTETPPPTETPRPTETPWVPTSTPEPTKTPPPEPTVQPPTTVPTATAQPANTPEPPPTDAPPTPTKVPKTATPVPPVVETPKPNDTATPPQPPKPVGVLRLSFG